MHRTLPILALSIVLVLAPTAGADIIRYSFTGAIDTVTQNDGGVLGSVSNGTTFAGTFWFDTDTPDTDPDSSRSGEYVHTDNAGIEVTIAGQTYSFEGESVFVRVRSFLDADFFQLRAQEFGDVDSGAHRFWDFGIDMTDSDASAFDNDDLPTDMSGTSFNTRRFRMIGELRNNAATDFWIEGEVSTVSLYQPPPPAGHVRGDFNGDGKADILWRNTFTGRNAVWRMDGQSRQSTAGIVAVGNRDWNLRGVFDFDGDDDSDLVWRNQRSGANVLWRMQGETFVNSVTLPTVGTHWLIGGVGDFDKDGHMDILWRNTLNGQNNIWRLDDDTTLLTNTGIPGLANQNWRMAGVDDFDGNGGSDILWRHRVSGEIAIWVMNALWRQSVVSLGAILPARWEVAGVADYDGDGDVEILFYDPVSGAAKMAFLSDLELSQLVDVSHLVTRHWKGAGHEIGPGAGGAAAVALDAPALRALTAHAPVPEPASALTLLTAAALLLPRRRP